jgi:hypothetical protein
VGAGEIIYRHRERRPQLLSGQTRPIGTGQEISRSASDYEREGEVMPTNGEMIDQIQEWLNTDGELLSDEQVIENIRELLNGGGL